MKKTLLFSMFLTFMCFATLSAAHENNIGGKNIEVLLELSRNPDGVVAHLTVINHSDEVFYLERDLFGLAERMGPIFGVYCGNEWVSGGTSRESIMSYYNTLLGIGPKSSLHTNLLLNEEYSLDECKEKIGVQYKNFVRSDITAYGKSETGELYTLESDWVELPKGKDRSVLSECECTRQKKK